MRIKALLFAALALALTGCSNAYNSKIDHSNIILKDNSGIRLQIQQADKIKTKADKDDENKLNYKEQKAIWLSYIDLSELFYEKTEQEFITSFEEVCKSCRSIGVNTLYIHCRAFGDAFYRSKLFQKTKTFGKISYDPLELMIEVAHNNALSVHAWINPLRCEAAEQLDNADTSLQITKWYKTGDDRIKYISADNHYWLDPAYEEVRNLICDGVSEIIKSYDVDGIHFDDYFYPTTDEEFDKQAFKASGEESLEKWRTENINKLVRDVYTTVKSIDSTVLFGISPQGNIDNNYSYMYADVGKWCSEEGYIDYIAPQIYFGFENSVLPFESCASQWNALIKNKNISLVIGLAAYKIYSDEEYINNTDILLMQINSIKSLDNYSGYAFYNYISLFPIDSEKADAASIQIEGIKKQAVDDTA